MARDDRRERARDGVTPMARIEADARRRGDAGAAPTSTRGSRSIDFGMTARLSSAMRETATRLLMALGDQRGDDVAATLIEMGEPRPDFDRVGYTREIATLVARNLELTAAEVQAGRVLFEMIDLSFRSGLRLPAEMTLLAKALFNLDGVTRALEPAYTPIDDDSRVRQPDRDVARAARHVAAPDLPARDGEQRPARRAAAPARPDHAAAREQRSRRRKVDVPQLPSLIVALQKVANRIFSGLVLAGLLVASAMLLPYWRTLGTVGFVIAAVLAPVHRAHDHGERPEARRAGESATSAGEPHHSTNDP